MRSKKYLCRFRSRANNGSLSAGRPGDWRTSARRRLGLEPLEARQLLSANPIINEFLARNDGGERDGDGRSSDWIEIYNAGDEPVDLAGHRLTDEPGNQAKWTFPSVPQAQLDPGDYLLVFASGREGPDFVDGQDKLHTSFTLTRGGEYIALVSPDGMVLSEYGSSGADYPEQLTNVSYGMAQSLTLFDSQSDASYLRPLSDSLGLSWTEPNFDAAANGFTPGTASMGLEGEPNARTNFTGQFETALPDGTHAVLARVEFDLNSGAAISDLLLRLKYDNGYVVYLNGVKVAEENAPTNLGWAATATDHSRRDSAALEFVDLDLSDHVGELVDGKNVLAIHGLNHFQDIEDMLLVAELHAGASDMLAATGSPAKVGYITTLTPGGPNPGNSEIFSGFVADTQFSVDRGFYNEAFQVEITTDTADATIRYTTDGSTPTADHGDVYSGPITISTTTPLRAAAFKEDFLPTNTDTQTYIFVNDVVNQGNTPEGYPTQWGLGIGPVLPADYEMDPEITQNPAYKDILDDALLQIPTVSIVTDIDHLFDPDTGIYQSAEASGPAWERPASVELIYPDGTVGFQEDAGLRIQGGASRITTRSPKHSFRLLFKGEYGASKLQYRWFEEETAVDEFDTIILRAGFNQSWIHHNTFLGDNRGRAQYVRDQWAKDTQRAMGYPAPHNTYAHLYVNGMYWGLYNPTERPTDDFGASYFGGEKDEYDVYNSGELLDGTPDAWNKLWTEAGDDLSIDAEYQEVASILDIEAYIDYMIINHYGANADWDDHNWYSTRRRTDDGKWQFYMWDSEFLFIGVNDNALRVSDGPRFPARLLRHLRANEEFVVQYADHLQRHLLNDGLLTPASALERWEAKSNQITDAIVAESARWGDYRRDVDNSGTPLVLLERDVHWVAERERLLNDYFPVRTDIVLEQYRDDGLFPSIDAPIYSQHGGPVPEAYPLTIANPNNSGTVYYTLDGFDPRVPGGDVAASALVYDGTPIVINQDQQLKTRLLAGQQWSALSEATFLISAPDSPFNLRITEVNYDPQPANVVAGTAEAEVDNDEFEFVELTNISTQAISLDGVQLAGAIEFAFPAGSTLAPGQYLLAVKNQSAFQSRYGEGLNIAGQFTQGNLSDTGETIQIRDADGNGIQSFTYGLGIDLPPRANGLGGTLELIDPSVSPRDPTNLRGSADFGGSPGAAPQDADSPIIVSEVLTHSTSPQADAIELHNTSRAEVDISNWYLGDSEGLYQFQIPSPVSIPAGGYRVFDQSQTGIGLNSGRGDSVWVVQADASGRPLRFVDHVQFGPAAQGVSLGPWPNLDSNFVPLDEPTLGSANAGLRFGDVLITELHYNPTDVDGPGPVLAKDLEFIELYNRTDQAIDLGDWRFEGINFTFDAGTTIQPKSTLLVLPFDPERGTKAITFRFFFNVDSSTPLVGKSRRGTLDDDGQLLRLERPDLAPVEEPTFIPYLTVDEVLYADVAPWPSGADGTGDSLTRITDRALGSNPSSWTAQAPSPSLVNFVQRTAGDANEDGQFDQADIVLVLQAGKFLTGAPATWSEGDWTGDGLFDQLDIVAALQTGSYMQGNLAAVRPAAFSHDLELPILAVDAAMENDELDELFVSS